MSFSPLISFVAITKLNSSRSEKQDFETPSKASLWNCSRQVTSIADGKDYRTVKRYQALKRVDGQPDILK